MPRPRHGQRYHDPDKWQFLSIKFLAAILAIAVVSGCRSKPELNPQAEYEQARVTMIRGDLINAERQTKEARSRYSERSPEWAWKFRILEAEILAYRGLNQEALSTLNSPLPIEFSSGDQAIRKLLVEALALSRSGHDQEADEHLLRADQLCRLTQSTLDGELARIYGVIELGRGDPDQAEAFFRQSLKAARRNTDRLLEATTLLNLGLTALKQEHYDNSVLWSTRAYDALRALGMQFAEQKVLGNLGWAYYRMGDAEKSAFYFQQAAEKARKLNASNDLMKWLLALGMVSESQDRMTPAKDFYLQSLSLAQRSQNPQDLVDALTALAAISVEQQEWDQAELYARQAVEICRSNKDRQGELDALLVQAKLAAHQQDDSYAENLLREVMNDRESETPLKWEAQENLARLYEDEHRPDEAARQYKLSLATFESARAALHEEELRLPFLSNAAHLEDDYIHFLVTKGAIAEALQVADYSRAETLAEALGSSNAPAGAMHSVSATDPRRIASRMNATVLFYWLGPRYAYLWIVNPKRVSVVPLPPTSTIEDLVRSYLRQLNGPRDPLAAANQNGIDLYNLLVAPAHREIAQTPRTIVISDGILSNLSFDALLVPSPTLHYLIDDTTIINSNSFRLLKLSPRVAGGKGKLLLIGDPLSSGHDYSDLPNAAFEINSVADHFPQSDRLLFTGAGATNHAYLNSNLQDYAYIHFVAHATASRLSPLDSAVILSRSAATEDDSFKLYARDVVRHPIHAELVTISTCYGAGARAYAGEGLVGLSWAFLHAGAHDVIAALWEASDAATPQLMDHLYTELGKGSSPEVALRAAKRALIHSESVFRKPLYWAPFQLYSNEIRPPAS